MVLLLTLEEHSIDCFLYLFVLCGRVQIYFYVSLINEIAGSDCIDIFGVISHCFSCVLSSDRCSCLFEPPGSGGHSPGAEEWLRPPWNHMLVNIWTAEEMLC